MFALLNFSKKLQEVSLISRDLEAVFQNFEVSKPFFKGK